MTRTPTFTNRFFSIAGQRERISNVGQTLKAAVTLRGVQANTGNRTTDTILSAAASNPYLTAFIPAAAKVAAGGAAVGSAKVAAGGAAAAKTSAAAKAASLGAAKTGGLLRTGALIGGGLLAGSLLNKGGSQTQEPTQDLNPFQEVGQTQEIETNPYQTGDLGDTGAWIRGDGNIIDQRKFLRQEQPTLLYPFQTAQPIQQTSAQQETGQSATNTDWLMVALVGAGAYLLLKD